MNRVCTCDNLLDGSVKEANDAQIHRFINTMINPLIIVSAQEAERMQSVIHKWLLIFCCEKCIRDVECERPLSEP